MKKKGQGRTEESREQRRTKEDKRREEQRRTEENSVVSFKCVGMVGRCSSSVVV